MWIIAYINGSIMRGIIHRNYQRNYNNRGITMTPEQRYRLEMMKDKAPTTNVWTVFTFPLLFVLIAVATKNNLPWRECVNWFCGGQ